MNPFDLLKDFDSIKKNLGNVQNELGQITATGSSGGNIVNVTINGKFEITNLRLDPICVDPRDVKMLEDLIVAAHHDALTKVQEEIKNKFGPMLGGLQGLA
ncbi:MAG: YbaB/EbfC family nucleoid-associated protein [Treponema sp.]|nr:YbaB/EbfC family nucleoid-associated protein [Treponema sp.]